jgi:hypothetical protein
MNDDLVKRLRVNRASLQMWLGEHLLEQYEKERTEASDRIEQLEAALRTIYECCDETGNCSVVRRIARKALEGKDER